jgi:putative transposase
LLGSEPRRDLFLRILERVRRRYRLVILAYVVMPEHIHSLMSEPQRATLSTEIQALKLGFVRSLYGSADNLIPRSRKGGGTWGTQMIPHRFWQSRFYDFNVSTERKRIEKLRYMHRNPVKRGLVDSPTEWRWSSFRWYSCGEVGTVRLNNTEILLLAMQKGAT